MQRNEFMLVAAALVITGVLKVAEMPAKAISYFGTNPVVLAMSLPKLPMIADVPAAPEMPQMAIAAELPPAPEALRVPQLRVVPSPSVHVKIAGIPDAREIAKINADVRRALAQAKCQKKRNAAALAQARELEVHLNGSLRRALVLSEESLKGSIGTE
jgi:hypothetical protein